MSKIKHFIKRAPVYAAASALVGVSAVMNARYGATLGSNDLDRAVWIAASASSDILKAASPLAIAWSWRNRNAFSGLAAVGLLSITVTYSAVAAIGFAASSRDTATSGRGHDAARIERAQSAYDKATTELKTVGNPRPISALEARISSILANPLADTPKGPCGTLDGDYTRKYCPLVADLKVELAKAGRKRELETTIEKTKTILDTAPAIQTADPQGEALASYGRAAGFKLDAKTLQPWLAGIAALLVELGSVFGFLVAGSIGPAHRQKKANGNHDKREGFTTGPVIEHEPLPAPDSIHGLLQITHSTGMSPIEGIERRTSGKLKLSQRRLAASLGRGRRTIAQELKELAGKGLIALEATRTGTMITLSA